MITKQQVLEFIYDLSQKTEVKIDVPNGIISVYEDFKYVGVYHYKFQKEKASLEELVTGFIKSYLDIELLKDIKIPVDIDMLKVGQTYRLGTGETLYLTDITEYKLIFTHTKNNIIFGIDKEDIKEIYEVQNDN